jgi:creatinine amidohydrolase/Fe(II)-dependent formamide hydrolase-like protein
MTKLFTTATLLLAVALLPSCSSQNPASENAGATPAAASQPVDSVYLEDLTWVEVRDAIAAGKTTAIIPTGGTEQNGPHMALGKHNAILKVTMDRVARRLGDALVAPIVAYVPEGDVNPPTGHMRFPGTITLPNEYVKLLEYAARSLKLAGFRDIVLIGDSGGNQEGMQQVAGLLNEEWASQDVRVHFIGEYYSANGFAEWLLSQGESEEAVGAHASVTDTAQLLAAAPQMVRLDKLAPGGGFEGSGVDGDPSHASVEYGRKGLDMKVDVAVERIRALRDSSR